MRLFAWLVSAVVFATTASGDDHSKDAGQFFNPPDAVDGTHDYSANPVYELGEIQTIKFTTIYPNYKINIWQQKLGENAATIGPIIFSAEGGAVTTFDWLVQPYQFDLAFSDMFFFWLTSTKPSKAGEKSVSITSHFFNITKKAETTSSSFTTRPTLTSTSTSSTASALTTSDRHSTDVPQSNGNNNAPSQGLTPGAQAGIGVGAALAGLATIIVAFVFVRRSRRAKKGPVAETLPGYHNTPGEGGVLNMVDQARYEGYKQETYSMPPLISELEGRPGIYQPVELPAGRENRV
ncbi:hypothetical protein GGS20DRAFT_583023 [Poronia punctata]|nr:hypothetical protein GGS20DRAFT_583023 [Poronia punctata]